MSLYDDLLKVQEVEEVVATAPKVEQPVLKQAIQNLPGSTLQLGKDIVTPLLQPITTAKSVYALGKGIVQLAIPGEQKDEKTARAVGQYFANRYGGLENIKQTFAKDPAGFLADASIVLTGGATIAAKTPKLAATAEKVGKVGQAIDPVRLSLKGAQKVASPVSTAAKETLGLTTGVGSEAIGQAFKAGATVGSAQERFIRNMREDTGQLDVVDRAFVALKDMGSQRAAEYTSGIKGLKLAEQPIDFAPIQKQMSELVADSFYEGIPKYDTPTIKKLQDVKNVVDEFASNPKTHTAEGLDILKRKIDDLYPLQAKAKGEQRIIADIRSKVKNEILEQVPGYADVMRPYEEALNLEIQLAKELSLNKKGAAGTTLRKLQSTMRNNVNTSYGNRLDMLNKLDPDLLPDLAGQALSEFRPRGLQGAVGSGTAIASLLEPGLAATLPFQSPRLMGEAALKAGQARRAFRAIPQQAVLPTARASRLGSAIGREQPEQMTPEEIQRLEYLNSLLQ